MRHIKRALALAAALALALALALPAAAVNWDDFYIVKQPPETLYIRNGESFTLSVEANIPAGAGPVLYRWYRSYGDWIEGAATATLRLSPGDFDYPGENTFVFGTPGPPGSHRAEYGCVITAFDLQGARVETIETTVARVNVKGSFWDTLYGLTLEPLAFGFSTLEIFFPIGPIVMIPYIIARYIGNFSWLFS